MTKRVPENRKMARQSSAAPARDRRKVSLSQVTSKLSSSKSAKDLLEKPMVKKLLEKKQALMREDESGGQLVFNGEVLMPRQSSKVLRFAIVFSILFHLALLMVKFTNPAAFNNFLQTTSLEVILINVTTPEAPTEAKFVAPKDSAGGGESITEGVIPTSPDEYSPIRSEGDSWEDVIQQQNLQREQTVRLLTSAKEAFSFLAPIDPSWGADDPRRIAEEERRRQLSDRIAAIEQKVQEESSRPRRMYIGPAARSHVQAVYYDSIRKKIELKGTESFPQYKGTPMYGSLLMEVSVNPSGELAKAVILESSGNVMLDRQAQAIAASAGPFPPAPAELMKAERNVEFVFIMRFKFMNDGRVETELRERASAPRAR